MDLRIDDSLGERFSGKADKPQPKSIDRGLLRLQVDRHPDRSGFEWKQVMVFGRGLEANDASRYTLTGENDLALKVIGIICSGIKPTVWGTAVPKHDVFDPTTGSTGRAKFFVPSNRTWDFSTAKSL
jgi:hypothetical protein